MTTYTLFMITPIEIDCPQCGKPNEYSLGSCRKCGLAREEFDNIEQNEEVFKKMGERMAAKSSVRADLIV